MDRVTGDRDAVPTAAHRAVRAPERLLEAELLHLLRGRRDRRLLKIST